MAADMTTLQGEVAVDPTTHADVEKLLAGFLEALLVEQGLRAQVNSTHSGPATSEVAR